MSRIKTPSQAERNETYEYAETEGICIYCGMPEECWDHALPYSQRHRKEARKRLLVPSCSECNSLLGNSLQETLGDRVAYCKTKLQAKYSSLLQSPRWTSEELSELGEVLRREVIHHEHKRKRTQTRIDFDYFTWVRLGRPEDLLPS